MLMTKMKIQPNRVSPSAAMLVNQFCNGLNYHPMFETKKLPSPNPSSISSFSNLNASSQVSVKN